MQEVLYYCRGHGQYADVIPMCEAYVPRDERALDVAAEPGVEGCVYLAKSGRHYKIGRSSAVGRRAYELAIQLPEKLTLVHSISTDDPTGIEAYWHKRFESRRGNGEWFELSAQDVKAFRRRTFM